jgi:hypothetical protein
MEHLIFGLATTVSPFNSSLPKMLLPKISSLAAVLCCLDGASAFYAITGVKTGVTADGFRPARRNINDLYNDVNQL